MSTPNALPMWTIYHDVKDFPGETIARLFLNDQPTDQVILGASLDQLRIRFISMGLVSIGRFNEDEPQVVEVWI